MELKWDDAISLDLRIYSKSAIFKTAENYSDIGDFYFHMGRDEFEFVLKYKLHNEDNFNHNEFCREFMKQLLYQSVRNIVTEQTQTTKELIIGRALYQTCVLASTGDLRDE